MNFSSFDHKKAFHAYASIFVLALVAAFVSILFWNLMLPRRDFYNELWGPSYLLVRRQSPYNTASLQSNLPAAWLPMAIGFFFPIGWLPEELALQAWYILNILEICLIVYLAQGANRNFYNTIVLALMCFFFPPVLNHLNLGQFSITATLCWILAAYFMEKDRRWIAAFSIGLALSKPHLGFLAVLGLSYRDLVRGGLRVMLSSWARIFAVCLILCMPLFIAYPSWIPDAIASMKNNLPWSYPSLYVLFQRYFGVWGYVLWGITTLVVIKINFLLSKKFSLKTALYWSLALAPLATAYIGSWDFVVLFPLLISTYASVDWKRKVFLLISYCIAWLGMARIQMLEVSHNHYFWWVPLCFIGVVTLVTDWKIKREE